MSNPVTRLNAALEGRYRVERQLGEGGMATVYLARDEKHNRNVALKVLKPELAAVVGAERFLAEIETTANLQHPHILPLFDSGEADGFLFYVMPYVEGESLRERLDREHQLPVEEAVQIATKVAGALQAAHEQGVIHRDIKPANVLLSKGEPLVSDFGIALAVGAAGGGRLTETGLSLGTPHYMSPEQATGDLSVGAATDIYALGCVLYEMLVGEPPFTGSTPQAVLGKIVTGDAPSAAEVRKSVPPNVDAAIRRALEKVPADRFTSGLGFATALADPQFRVEATGVSHSTWVAGWRSGLAVILAVVAAGGLGWLTGQVGSRPASPSLPLRFTIPVPEGLDLGWNIPVLVSPDSRSVIYKSGNRLYRRRLDAFEPEPLEGTEGAFKPTYSPDGEWIAFSQDSRLRRMSSRGGPITQVASVRVDDSTLGLDWGDGDGIVFTRGLGHDGVWRIHAFDGGEAEQLTTVRDSLLETVHAWPQLLPGSRHLLFTTIGPSGGWEDASVIIKDLETGERHRVIEQGATFAKYVDPGYLVYVDAAGTIQAARFDLDDFTIEGNAVPMESPVRTSWWGGWASFDVSPTGTAAFIRGTAWEDAHLSLIDREGNVLRRLGDAASDNSLALSPDQDRIAVSRRGPENDDIYLVDLATGRPTRLTFAAAEDETPEWSPDGERVAYSSAWTGEARRIYVKDAVSGADPSLLYTADGHVHLTSWSEDGAWLLFDQFDPEDQTDIYALGVGGTDEIIPIATTQAAEADARFSPDGRWIAYTSQDQGGSEVQVVSFPGGDVQHQVSTDGGIWPRWTREGELFYWRGTTLMVAPVSTGDAFSWETPRALFDATDIWTYPYVEYEVMADGQTIVAQIRNPDAGLSQVHVVHNWLTELCERMGDC